MNIYVISVGKVKEKYLRDALSEYSKRLSKYCKLEIVEVQDEKLLRMLLKRGAPHKAKRRKSTIKMYKG